MKEVEMTLYFLKRFSNQFVASHSAIGENLTYAACLYSSLGSRL